jgi:hypothetical protein
VGQIEPGGALVVEVRQRALFQLGRAFGVARFKARIADSADPVSVRAVNVAPPRAVD